MNCCVLCKSQLSEHEKPEHILLDAFGGRKTTRDVLCSVCNNKMGAGPDKDLAESVAPLRTIANLKSGSRKKAPSLHEKPASGDSYDLGH
ncbi:HNH endonuclease [Nioella ostreopsis]|uniref:HNH endonuclease n=1 Tax=Nioella ostreopsis TaxID=2448479 RepID=UPI000FD6D4CF